MTYAKMWTFELKSIPCEYLIFFAMKRSLVSIIIILTHTFSYILLYDDTLNSDSMEETEQCFDFW
jgi:hypothetical protein